MALHRDTVRYVVCAVCGYDRRRSEVVIYPGCGDAVCLRCSCAPPLQCPVYTLEEQRRRGPVK